MQGFVFEKRTIFSMEGDFFLFCWLGDGAGARRDRRQTLRRDFVG
jgi:hypothetical protein